MKIFRTYILPLFGFGVLGLGAFLFANRPAAKFEKIKFIDVKNDQSQFAAMIKALGVQKTMAKLLTESGGGSAFDCHQEAHEVGRVGYQIEGNKVFAECDSSCHSGCYHGAMEGLLHEKGSKNLVHDVNEVCDIFDTRFGTFECFHGVGHGLLAYVAYDMPKGIDECKRLDTKEKGLFCLSGLFMENVVTAQGWGASKQAHTTNWVSKTDPHFPCNALSQDYDTQYTCYHMQTSWMLTMYGYDFDKVSAACLTAPKDMIPVCFESFGRDVAGQTLRDPKKILNLCTKAPDQYFEQCISGAVQVIIDFWGPGLKNQASVLCASVPENHKTSCYSIVGSRLNDLFKSGAPERKAVCDSFEASYQHLCTP